MTSNHLCGQMIHAKTCISYIKSVPVNANGILLQDCSAIVLHLILLSRSVLVECA